MLKFTIDQQTLNNAYWDGTNGYGERVASGIYYYTIATENFTSTKKMVVAK